MNTNMIGFFKRTLHPCTLEESGRSIGWVNMPPAILSVMAASVGELYGFLRISLLLYIYSGSQAWPCCERDSNDPVKTGNVTQAYPSWLNTYVSLNPLVWRYL